MASVTCLYRTNQTEVSRNYRPHCMHSVVFIIVICDNSFSVMHGVPIGIIIMIYTSNKLPFWLANQGQMQCKSNARCATIANCNVPASLVSANLWESRQECFPAEKCVHPHKCTVCDNCKSQLQLLCFCNFAGRMKEKFLEKMSSFVWMHRTRQLHQLQLLFLFRCIAAGIVKEQLVSGAFSLICICGIIQRKRNYHISLCTEITQT